MGYPTAGTEYRSARPAQVAPRPGPTRRPAANRTQSSSRRPPGAPPAPPGRRPGTPSPNAHTPRRVPLRLTIALLVTVGAVVLLGMAEDAADSDGRAGADCATNAATVSDLSAVQTGNARTMTE